MPKRAVSLAGCVAIVPADMEWREHGSGQAHVEKERRKESSEDVLSGRLSNPVVLYCWRLT